MKYVGALEHREYRVIGGLAKVIRRRTLGKYLKMVAEAKKAKKARNASSSN